VPLNSRIILNLTVQTKLILVEINTVVQWSGADDSALTTSYNCSKL